LGPTGVQTLGPMGFQTLGLMGVQTLGPMRDRSRWRVEIAQVVTDLVA